MKSKPKDHTPGPWKIHKNIGRKSELGIVADAAPCIIAIMANAKQWPVEARANAQLIAAAPDLLTVCELALERLNCANRCRTTKQGEFMVSDIESAILKATEGK